MTEDLESGAPLMGRMAFDIEKARQTCEKLQEYYDSDWHPQGEPIIVSDSARLLPAALAEIERLTLSLDELKKQLKFDRQSLDCYRSQNIDYTMEKAAQAKRIAELEAGMKSGFAGYQYRIIAKQRAALKKLGQAKRTRGKALVEERAKTTGALLCEYADEELHCDEREMWCDWDSCTINNKARQKIREQLRSEGKL